MIDKTSNTSQPPAPRLVYSRKEAAYLLSISLRNIAYRIAQGTVKIRRQGGRVVISHAELLKQAAMDDNKPITPKRSLRKPPLPVTTAINPDDIQNAAS
jgi:hypothetical protein